MNAKLCPKCGSGKVEIKGSSLGTSSVAKCQNCDWEGQEKDLVVYALEQVVNRELTAADLIGAPDAATAIAMMVSKEYMNKLAAYASQPIGLAMIESGLIGQKDVATLSRLLRAACLAAHKATLEEMSAIQKEMQGAGPGN